MSTKIEFSFTPTQDDVTRGLRAFAMKQRRNWVLLGVLAVVAVVLLGRIATDGYDQFAPYGIFAGIVFVLYAGFVFVVNPWREGRNFGKNRASQLKQTWTTGRQGFSVSVRVPDGRIVSKSIDWERFNQVYQVWSYYLMQEVGDTAAVHIIPKRAFQSEKQRERFWGLVRGNTRKTPKKRR